MRDMLFSMPLGPMPGPKAEVKPPLGPVPPQFQWKPVEGNSQVEVNGLGQMRTCMPEPEFVAVDTAMMVADMPRVTMLNIDTGIDRGSAMVGLLQDVEFMISKILFGKQIYDHNPPDVGEPFNLDSLPGCFCDSCNQWRKLGR